MLPNIETFGELLVVYSPHQRARTMCRSGTLCSSHIWSVKFYSSGFGLPVVVRNRRTAVTLVHSNIPANSELFSARTVRVFCSIVQRVTVEGSLAVDQTPCNGVLHATVDVWNPEGATIVNTDLIEVRHNSLYYQYGT